MKSSLLLQASVIALSLTSLPASSSEYIPTEYFEGIARIWCAEKGSELKGVASFESAGETWFLTQEGRRFAKSEKNMTRLKEYINQITDREAGLHLFKYLRATCPVKTSDLLLNAVEQGASKPKKEGYDPQGVK